MVVKIEEDALASVRKAHFVAAAIGNSRRGSVFEHANFLRVHAALKRGRRRSANCQCLVGGSVAELLDIEAALLISRTWPGLRFRASISIWLSLFDSTAALQPSGILLRTNVSAPSSADAAATHS